MKRLVVFASAAALTGGAYALDFGQKIEQQLKASSLSLFGVLNTVNASSTTQITGVQAEADPTQLVTLAPGLTANVVSKDSALGGNVDQIVLWPTDTSPTHLIFCNEEGTAAPGVQRVTIATGAVETILTGTNRCDPVRKTAWGTIFFAEENGAASRVYEIIDPLNVTNVTLVSSVPTGGTNPGNIVQRTALGALSFEGFAVLPNGVIYYGDENRPGTNGVGAPGGSFFKFIPDTLWNPGDPPITNLSQSPLVSGGHVYGFRPGRNGGSFSNTDVGQGNEFGRGWWVEVVNGQIIGGVTITRSDLRTAAQALRLAAYYRPEDIDVDPKQLALGKVRFCGTNTGQDVQNGDNHWGEVYCITDGTLPQAGDKTTATQTLTTSSGAGSIPYTVLTGSIPEYQPLVIGNFQFAMMDNIAFQPGRGNLILHEDGEGPASVPARGNDLWDCLDDGADTDILSDGCVRIASINDQIGAGSGGGGAEWTGGIFDATGQHFYVSIQHAIGTGTSGTPGPTYAHGYILDITGWQ